MAKIPKITPSTIAPPVNYTNSFPISNIPMLPPLQSSKLIVNKIIQLPSFRRLYPSISELNFLGAPASLSKASTATVSVQDKTEPNIKA